MDEAHRSYTFDVDALESNDPDAAENPPDEYKYSVEAYSCGTYPDLTQLPPADAIPYRKLDAVREVSSEVMVTVTDRAHQLTIKCSPSHSCEPNVSVISVMWDSIPQVCLVDPLRAFLSDHSLIDSRSVRSTDESPISRIFHEPSDRCTNGVYD